MGEIATVQRQYVWYIGVIIRVATLYQYGILNVYSGHKVAMIEEGGVSLHQSHKQFF